MQACPAADGSAAELLEAQFRQHLECKLLELLPAVGRLHGGKHEPHSQSPRRIKHARARLRIATQAIIALHRASQAVSAAPAPHQGAVASALADLGPGIRSQINASLALRANAAARAGTGAALSSSPSPYFSAARLRHGGFVPTHLRPRLPAPRAESSFSFVPPHATALDPGPAAAVAGTANSAAAAAAALDDVSREVAGLVLCAARGAAHSPVGGRISPAGPVAVFKEAAGSFGLLLTQQSSDDGSDDADAAGGGYCRQRTGGGGGGGGGGGTASLSSVFDNLKHMSRVPEGATAASAAVSAAAAAGGTTPSPQQRWVSYVSGQGADSGAHSLSVPGRGTAFEQPQPQPQVPSELPWESWQKVLERHRRRQLMERWEAEELPHVRDRAAALQRAAAARRLQRAWRAYKQSRAARAAAALQQLQLPARHAAPEASVPGSLAASMGVVRGRIDSRHEASSPALPLPSSILTPSLAAAAVAAQSQQQAHQARGKAAAGAKTAPWRLKAATRGPAARSSATAGAAMDHYSWGVQQQQQRAAPPPAAAVTESPDQQKQNQQRQQDDGGPLCRPPPLFPPTQRLTAAEAVAQLDVKLESLFRLINGVLADQTGSTSRSRRWAHQDDPSPTGSDDDGDGDCGKGSGAKSAAAAAAAAATARQSAALRHNRSKTGGPGRKAGALAQQQQQQQQPKELADLGGAAVAAGAGSSSSSSFGPSASRMGPTASGFMDVAALLSQASSSDCDDGAAAAVRYHDSAERRQLFAPGGTAGATTGSLSRAALLRPRQSSMQQLQQSVLAPSSQGKRPAAGSRVSKRGGGAAAPAAAAAELVMSQPQTSAKFAKPTNYRRPAAPAASAKQRTRGPAAAAPSGGDRTGVNHALTSLLRDLWSSPPVGCDSDSRAVQGQAAAEDHGSDGYGRAAAYDGGRDSFSRLPGMGGLMTSSVSPRGASAVSPHSNEHWLRRNSDSAYMMSQRGSGAGGPQALAEDETLLLCLPPAAFAAADATEEPQVQQRSSSFLNRLSLPGSGDGGGSSPSNSSAAARKTPACDADDDVDSSLAPLPIAAARDETGRADFVARTLLSTFPPSSLSSQPAQLLPAGALAAAAAALFGSIGQQTTQQTTQQHQQQGAFSAADGAGSDLPRLRQALQLGPLPVKPTTASSGRRRATDGGSAAAAASSIAKNASDSLSGESSGATADGNGSGGGNCSLSAFGLLASDSTASLPFARPITRSSSAGALAASARAAICAIDSALGSVVGPSEGALAGPQVDPETPRLFGAAAATATAQSATVKARNAAAALDLMSRFASAADGNSHLLPLPQNGGLAFSGGADGGSAAAAAPPHLLDALPARSTDGNQPWTIASRRAATHVQEQLGITPPPPPPPERWGFFPNQAAAAAAAEGAPAAAAAAAHFGAASCFATPRASIGVLRGIPALCRSALRREHRATTSLLRRLGQTQQQRGTSSAAASLQQGGGCWQQRSFGAPRAVVSVRAAAATAPPFASSVPPPPPPPGVLEAVKGSAAFGRVVRKLEQALCYHQQQPPHGLDCNGGSAASQQAPYGSLLARRQQQQQLLPSHVLHPQQMPPSAAADSAVAMAASPGPLVRLQCIRSTVAVAAAVDSSCGGSARGADGTAVAQRRLGGAAAFRARQAAQRLTAVPLRLGPTGACCIAVRRPGSRGSNSQLRGLVMSGGTRCSAETSSTPAADATRDGSAATAADTGALRSSDTSATATATAAGSGEHYPRHKVAAAAPLLVMRLPSLRARLLQHQLRADHDARTYFDVPLSGVAADTVAATDDGRPAPLLLPPSSSFGGGSSNPRASAAAAAAAAVAAAAEPLCQSLCAFEAALDQLLLSQDFTSSSVAPGSAAASGRRRDMSLMASVAGISSGPSAATGGTEAVVDCAPVQQPDSDGTGGLQLGAITTTKDAATAAAAAAASVAGSDAADAEAAEPVSAKARRCMHVHFAPDPVAEPPPVTAAAAGEAAGRSYSRAESGSSPHQRRPRSSSKSPISRSRSPAATRSISPASCAASCAAGHTVTAARGAAGSGGGTSGTYSSPPARRTAQGSASSAAPPLRLGATAAGAVSAAASAAAAQQAAAVHIGLPRRPSAATTPLPPPQQPLVRGKARPLPPLPPLTSFLQPSPPASSTPLMPLLGAATMTASDVARAPLPPASRRRHSLDVLVVPRLPLPQPQQADTAVNSVGLADHVPAVAVLQWSDAAGATAADAAAALAPRPVRSASPSLAARFTPGRHVPVVMHHLRAAAEATSRSADAAAGIGLRSLLHRPSSAERRRVTVASLASSASATAAAAAATTPSTAETAGACSSVCRDSGGAAAAEAAAVTRSAESALLPRGGATAGLCLPRRTGSLLPSAAHAAPAPALPLRPRSAVLRGCHGASPEPAAGTPPPPLQRTSSGGSAAPLRLSTSDDRDSLDRRKLAAASQDCGTAAVALLPPSVANSTAVSRRQLLPPPPKQRQQFEREEQCAAAGVSGFGSSTTLLPRYRRLSADSATFPAGGSGRATLLTPRLVSAAVPPPIAATASFCSPGMVPPRSTVAIRVVGPPAAAAASSSGATPEAPPAAPAVATPELVQAAAGLNADGWPPPSLPHSGSSSSATAGTGGVMYGNLGVNRRHSVQ